MPGGERLEALGGWVSRGRGVEQKVAGREGLL